MYLLNFNLNNTYAYFGFVSMRDNPKRLEAFRKGMHKDYAKKLEEQIILGNLKKTDNLLTGSAYLEAMSPKYSTKSTVPKKLIPLETTNNEGKRITVGLREIYQHPTKTGGYTVTHKAHKNLGAQALLETMNDYAKADPRRQHYITGDTYTHSKLYQKELNKLDPASRAANLFID